MPKTRKIPFSHLVKFKKYSPSNVFENNVWTIWIGIHADKKEFKKQKSRTEEEGVAFVLSWKEKERKKGNG